MFNTKIMQSQIKGQFLHQKTVSHLQKHNIGGTAFRQADTAAKGMVVIRAQTTDGRHL